jgi:GNAT superfamily N-acetyltransferase
MTVQHGMHVDPELARRLERTEGMIGTSFIEARRKVSGVDAAWHDFAGTCAIFDGADSPLTQTFGLAMTTADALAPIEEFFTSRGAPVQHEVSPYAGVETFALLASRGYVPNDLSTVLVQPLTERPEPAWRARVATAADRDAFVETSVHGWSDDPAVALIIRSLAAVAFENRSMLHYIVERDGAPIATGSLGVFEGIALLAGASTVPSARGAGAQSALLATRLADARARGCEYAMMVTAVGSASQRNAERNGFQVAYTRTKWRRG